MTFCQELPEASAIGPKDQNIPLLMGLPSHHWPPHRPRSSLSTHPGLSLLPLWAECLAHLTLRPRLREPESGPEGPGTQSLLPGQGLIGEEERSAASERKNHSGSLVLGNSHLRVPRGAEGGRQLGSLLKRDGAVLWVRGWILSHDSFPTQTPAPLCIMIWGTWGAPCSLQPREPELWSSEQGLVLGLGCAGLGWRPPATQTRGSAPSASQLVVSPQCPARSASPPPCTAAPPHPLHRRQSSSRSGESDVGG